MPLFFSLTLTLVTSLLFFLLLSKLSKLFPYVLGLGFG